MIGVFRLIVMLAVLVGPAMPAHAQSAAPEGQEPANWQILVKPVTPFVMRADDGQITGFSIDLWQAIERKLAVRSHIVMLPDLNALLNAVKDGKGDLAIAAVTITAERERLMDFSHSYFRSGLQIAVRPGQEGVFAKTLSVLKAMFKASSFRFAMMALAILVLVMAHIMWFLERKRNPDFTRSYPLGLWDAVYWTLVTISTVGYGDKTPKTNAGRAVALVLIVFGYVAFAWFTATITSAVTVSELTGSINGPQDLAGKTVATVRNSTSEKYLQRLPGVQLRSVDQIEQAYELLDRQEVQAIVYDFPVLSYFALHDGAAKIRLTGPVFQREPYGIVFPKGSQLREAVNQALLQVVESGEYEIIYRKWFAAAPN